MNPFTFRAFYLNRSKLLFKWEWWSGKMIFNKRDKKNKDKYLLTILLHFDFAPIALELMLILLKVFELFLFLPFLQKRKYIHIYIYIHIFLNV